MKTFLHLSHRIYVTLTGRKWPDLWSTSLVVRSLVDGMDHSSYPRWSARYRWAASLGRRLSLIDLSYD